MEDVLVPLGLFAIIPVIVWSVSRFRHRSFLAKSEVLKSMIDRGETPTTEFIAALGVQPKKRHGDLRVGLILVAISIATILFGGAIPDDEATRIMGGIAMFPLLVGLVYMVMWFAFGRKEDA